MKNNEGNKKISRDISAKLYKNSCSSKNKNNNYSQKYSKNKFTNRNNKKSCLKNTISKSKESNNNYIKKDIPENKKMHHYISDNDMNKSDKTITLNLNDKNNIQIKNNKNIHINMNLINIPSHNQDFFSPVSSVFVQSHEKSLSILSTKNLYKKDQYISTDKHKILVEPLHNFNKNNLNKNSNEESESNNIVIMMNKEIKKFKNNTSFYLNGERNFFISPDGPEDFHFRFVELCKQNKDFYRRLKLDLGNKDKDKERKDVAKELYEIENKKYFENIEEEVPYI